MPFGDVVGRQQPANQRLWDMLVVQAKHRFRTYPSMAASHWIHDQYIKEGGMFVKSAKDVGEKSKRQPEDSKPEHGGKKIPHAKKKKALTALKSKKRTIS